VRILSITAGAAGMYCGSCLRDNALAAALRAQGHDVVLLPLYTPTLTDEANLSEQRIFFGGISVYLEQKLPFFRHTPPFLDQIWDHPALIRAASSGAISNDPKMLGELTVSMLRGRAGFQTKELDKLSLWLRAQPPFDVINIPNSLLISLAEPIKAATGRPIVCTLQGEDLFLNGLSEADRRLAIDSFCAAGAFFERRIFERQIARAERCRKAEPRHHRVGIQPRILRVGVAVRREASVGRHPEELHRAVERAVVAHRGAGRAHARNHVLVRRFELRGEVAAVPEFRAGENCFEYRANIAVGREIAIRHPADQRLWRIVGDEILRELETQVIRGDRTPRQDIECALAFRDPRPVDALAQKSLARKIMTARVEVESVGARCRRSMIFRKVVPTPQKSEA
jgi:hypothetical protein